jgi:hypothetical protein
MAALTRQNTVGAGGEVGDVALAPGQRPGLGLQVPVDGVGAGAELDEPVAFDPTCDMLVRTWWLAAAGKVLSCGVWPGPG